MTPEKPLALHLTDRLIPPISVRLSVPLEPRGESTGPLKKKSSVKFCESKGTHQSVSTQANTGFSTRCFLFVDILSYCFDKEDVYIDKQVTQKVARRCRFKANTSPSP
ncbi:regenerating islet-derived protein 4 [Sarotherodon galilaeus]